MTLETFELTTLGAAAAAVVEDLQERRSAAEEPSALPLIKWDGKPIEKTGVYDMPIDAYHSNCCVGPSISSSGLRTIESKSLLHYWYDSYFNTDKEDDEEPKDHFELGRAVHTLLLGEEGFNKRFVIRPKQWKDWRTDAAKAWRAEQRNAGMTVLVPDNIIAIRAMADRLAAHSVIAMGLLNGEIERSLIWKDKETGIYCKARPDALPVNADLVADLKTTTDASAICTRRSIADYGYHMQAALVGMGIEAVLGRKVADDNFVNVFIETKKPFAINIKPLDPASLHYGRMQIRRALRKFADAVSKNEWPGYEDDEATASLPKFYSDRLEFEIKGGLLLEADAA